MQQILDKIKNPTNTGEQLWNKITCKIFGKKMKNKHLVYDETYYQENYLKHVNRWYGNLMKLYFKFIAYNCIIKTAKITKNSKILDVGCGVGIFTKELRKLDMDAIGIDVSKNAIEHSIDENCFFVDDSKKLDFPNSYFDLIISKEVLEHIPEKDIDGCIKEWDRVGKNKMIHIIAVTERGTSSIDDPLHITMKPEKWWINKFKEHNYKAIRRPSKLFFGLRGTHGYFMFIKNKKK